MNRNQSSLRPLPADVTRLTADVRDLGAARTALGDRRFDAVVDVTIFDPDQVVTDIDLFAGRTDQFVFISSASAYQKPVARLPSPSRRRSSTLLEYSRRKIACEDALVRAHREHGFR